MRRPKASEEEAYYNVEGTNYGRHDSVAHDAVANGRDKHSLRIDALSPKIIIVVLGLAVSLLANGVMGLAALLENWKVALVADTVAGVSGTDAAVSAWLQAWGIWMGSGVACALAASALVFVAPAAQSSGIPHVLAFLNGAVAPRVKNAWGRRVGPFDTLTLVSKAVGTVLAVASGLFLGPEGPLIHMGAILGRVLVRGLHYVAGERANTVLHHLSRGRVHAHTERWLPVDMAQRRDFLAIGAGAAITGAFSAPLAGVLFVVEEAATKITLRLLELAFLACASAFMLTWSLTGTEDTGHVKFDIPTSPMCPQYSWSDIIVFVLIAALGGLIGALFNQVVVALNKWRQRVVSPFPARRVFEVLVLAVVTCTASIVLPAVWACSELKPQVMMEGSTGCLKDQHWTQLATGLVTERDARRQYLRSVLESSGSSGGGEADYDSLGPALTLTPQELVWAAENLDPTSTRLVYFARNMTDVPYVSFEGAHAGGCAAGSFNEMATLFIKGSVKAVGMLLTRGSPHLFSAPALGIFLVVYSSLAAYTAGATLPSGLFIPHLLIGGAMGRLVGLFGLWVLTGTCVHPVPGVDPATVSMLDWALSGYRRSLASCSVPDPGTFAMIGAAAVMGGSGRITVFLAIVMLELTADITYMPVIAVTVVIAMWVGNTINHGLYHSLIPLLGIPFLEVEPHPAQAIQPVSRVMARPVATLPPRVSLDELEGVLGGSTRTAVRMSVTPQAQGHRSAAGAGSGAASAAASADPSAQYIGDGRRGLTIDMGGMLGGSDGDDDEASAAATSHEGGADVDAGHASRALGDGTRSTSDIAPARPRGHRMPSGRTQEHERTWFQDGTSRSHHNAFPVVSDDNRIVGIIERKLLARIARVMRDVRQAPPATPDPDTETTGQGTGTVASLQLWTGSDRVDLSQAGQVAQLADVDTTAEDALDAEIAASVVDPRHEDGFVDLRRVMQRAPFVVYERTSIARAFDLFRNLGLRHLCVIADNGRLVGIVTRKDLMTWRLDHAMAPALDSAAAGEGGAGGDARIPPLSPRAMEQIREVAAKVEGHVAGTAAETGVAAARGTTDADNKSVVSDHDGAVGGKG